MPSVPDTSRPMDYAGLILNIQTLKKQYGCVQSFPIGKSVLGRDLTAVILGAGKPQCLFVGGHHALEYITSMLLIRFARELCCSYASGQRL